MIFPLQIMKSDEDVRMISAEAPVLFARVSMRFMNPGRAYLCNKSSIVCDRL